MITSWQPDSTVFLFQSLSKEFRAAYLVSPHLIFLPSHLVKFDRLQDGN